MQIGGRRIRRRLCSPESYSISDGETSNFHHASLPPCPPPPQQSSSTSFQHACPPPPQQPHPPSPPPPQPHSPSQIGARNERDRRKRRHRSPESSSTSGLDEAPQQPHSPSTPPPPPPPHSPPPQHPPSPTSPATTPRSIRIKSSITTGGLDEHGFRILRTLFKQKDDRIFFNIRFVCTCGVVVKHSMMTGNPSFTFRSMAECPCGKDYHVVFEGNSYDVSCCRRGEYEEIAYYSGTVRE